MISIGSLLNYFQGNSVLINIAWGLAFLIGYLIVRELIWRAANRKPGQAVIVLLPGVGAILLYEHLWIYGLLFILAFVLVIVIVVPRFRIQK